MRCNVTGWKETVMHHEVYTMPMTDDDREDRLFWRSESLKE